MEESLTGLDGTPIPEVKIKQVLANSIAGGNSPEPAKFMNIALGIWNSTNEFKISNEDFGDIRTMIERDLTMSNIAKASLLKVFELAEEAVE